jgi:hypothetical protein
MPYQREAEIVLAAWRAVERDLQAVPADSDEAERLQADSLRLRDEYQRLIQAAREHHRPERPAFPASIDALVDEGGSSA